MKRMIILGFLLLLALDTAARVLMKIAAVRLAQHGAAEAWLQGFATEPLIYAIAALYATSFTTYVTLLKHAPVGPAYAAAHGNIVTVALVSVLVMGESLSVLQAAGAVLIVAGVVLLAVTEEPERAPEPGLRTLSA